MSLTGNNSLMYTLRILTSIEIFLDCEFYFKYPVLIDIYNNDKTVLGEEVFTSFDSVFELARDLVICQPIHLFCSKCGFIKYEKFNQ